METDITLEQAQNLQQQMNSLQTADGNFIQWYLLSLITGRRRITVRARSEVVYLPYDGKDPVVIMRLFKGYIRLAWKGFTIDETNLKAIEFLINIVCGKTDRKGLILRGECGVGKTILILVWLKFRETILAPPNLKKPIQRDDFNERLIKCSFFEPTSLFSGFENSKFEFFAQQFGDILVIDDLGLNTAINYFGTPTNIIENIILSRYVDFKANSNLEFYGSTNVTTATLSDLIGKRAASRLSEMAAWEEGLITGDDRRKDPSRLKVWPVLSTKNKS